MPTPLAARLIIGLSAALWLALAFALHAPVDKVWLKYLGGIASVVVGLLVVFDRWLWRWLPTALTKRPNLRGTWKVRLEYQWPENSPTQTKDGFIVIRQSYSSVSVDMHFDISDSQSRSAALVEANGRQSIWWSYFSIAHSLKQDGNPPHRGGAELVITDAPSPALVGDYWTERKTRGRMVARGRCKHIYDSYESAMSGTYA